MQNWSAKSRAEAKFAGGSKKKDPLVLAKEKAEKARAEHSAYLKSLRLAKEAEDREAAEKAALEKAAAKPAAGSRTTKAAKIS